MGYCFLVLESPYPLSEGAINLKSIIVSIYLYLRTSKYLGHLATQKEIDRMQILHSDFYKMVFGSWENFEALMRSENYADLFQ